MDRVLDADEADRMAVLVAACRGVARLADDGLAGHLATYLPGRRVSGLRRRADGLDVAVVARWGIPLADVADQVRAAVAPVAGGLPVDVHVVDVELPSAVAARRVEARPAFGAPPATPALGPGAHGELPGGS